LRLAVNVGVAIAIAIEGSVCAMWLARGRIFDAAVLGANEVVVAADRLPVHASAAGVANFGTIAVHVIVAAIATRKIHAAVVAAADVVRAVDPVVAIATVLADSSWKNHVDGSLAPNDVGCVDRGVARVETGRRRASDGERDEQSYEERSRSKRKHRRSSRKGSIAVPALACLRPDRNPSPAHFQPAGSLTPAPCRYVISVGRTIG
jgi:hypothetical protein